MALSPHSMSGGHGTHLSPAAQMAAVKALSSLSHDTISAGSGSDTVRIAGSATLHGSPWSAGSSSAAGGHAFSFDTLQAGGAQLLGNFAGQQTAGGGYTIASHGPESSSGGSSSISLDNGKTLINIKNLHR